jgi:hypothetical protein
MLFVVEGMGFSFIIYMVVGIVSIYSFGNNTDGNVMNNICLIPSWDSYVLRSFFLVVIATHTPFIMFVGKEALLTLIAQMTINTDPQSMLKNPDGSESIQSVHARETQKLIVNNVDARISHAVMPYLASVFSEKMKSTVHKESTILPPNNNGVADLIKPWIYYTSTLILYGLNIIGAIWINSTEDISGFIGSISCSLLNFFLPGVFFLVAARKNAGFNPPMWKKTIALCFSLYGITMGLMCTTVRVITLIQGEDD